MASSGGNAVLVGREVERRRLAQLLSDAAAERGGTFALLTGEPGIGKTTVARAFAAEAAAEGATVLSGSCHEGDWWPAYGPWLEALAGRGHTLPANSRR